MSSASLCVLFDLDGTLVDSETLCNQAFLDLIPELTSPVEEVVRRFRGLKLSMILTEIERSIGSPLPENFETVYRARVKETFESQLRPTTGVLSMLDAIPHARCIASGAPMQRIVQALALCGLTKYFGPHLFSSYDIASWKPDPDLFLHAARSMGARPEQCIVVEDSDVGLKAAKAAGMRALHYGSDAGLANLHGCGWFSDMSSLPRLLADASNALDLERVAIS